MAEDAALPAKPERRGYLLNQYTGSREYFVLRGGVLRIRQTKQGPDIGSVYLSQGSSVTLLANSTLQLNTRVPYAQEYILAASQEGEAEAWHDALHASIQAEQQEMARLTKLLQSGCTLHKYNYSNSKRTRRYFWVDDDGRELCWGHSKAGRGDDTQRVDLRECIGIIYGPMTTTFQRCPCLEDPAWTCFSLLFMGRTLDLTVPGDLQVRAWFLGMQHLISLHGIGSMPLMSDAQFLCRKVQFKLMGVAHRHGLVLGRYLLDRVRALGRGSSTSTNGTHRSVQKEPSQRGSKEPSHGRSGPLRARVLQTQAALREHGVQAEVARAVLKLPPGKSAEELETAARNTALDALRGRCQGMEEDVQKLSAEAEAAAPQLKAAEKAEKSIRKLQQRLAESEAKRMDLEQRLATARASTAAHTGAKTKSSTEEAEAKTKGDALQHKVKQLERKLQEAQAQRTSEREAAQNQRQDAALQAAEQERLALSQKLEAASRDLTVAKKAEQQSHEQLMRTQQLNSKLDAAVAPLVKAAKQLREEQAKARAEVLQAGGGFGAGLQRVLEGVAQLREQGQVLQEKYKVGMEERKKLHNQVLDLKGNIRVFVRVRPINSKETGHEPENEPTINFRDNLNIGVFDAAHGRRKWFEFDQVFSPDTKQVMVFEEAKPLATSVLDGYCVCIFAYGQTGSGKTHTMTGIPDDPGLNTRVLRELFRIRSERAGEYVINISLSITEIYNETIRDLLSPSSKKLDVKQNADGSCGVPGLSEEKVESVDDVMQCITRAGKNRAVSSTDMNEQSSRSHSIVTVKTQCTLLGSDTYIGKIHLIDLAGSENTNKSGVTGQGMKEAQNINKSLSALGDVIQSLVAKNTHTPYRNSKLTMMLKDSLGGDSKTLMIVCTSPAQFNVTETLSSLNFAARARNVELGKAKRNVAS